MWNLSFSPPDILDARVVTRLPDTFRSARQTEWSQANKPGQLLDSFLEGPSFDREGNLWVTDIPNGRLFRIDHDLHWTLVSTYDGWPNGSAFHQDGSLWIADYRRGILRLAPGETQPRIVLGHRSSESFKGINDLTFDKHGNCWFTDQGQTGMHDPTGRVYRLDTTGRLDPLLDNVPSPNGLVLDAKAEVLTVAATRANTIWRAPVKADGQLTKVGVLQTFFGASGPDGLALDCHGRLVVCHASLGGAFVLNPRGEISHYIRTPVGGTVTNAAYKPDTRTLVLVESQTASILEVTLPDKGLPLFSHA